MYDHATSTCDLLQVFIVNEFIFDRFLGARTDKKIKKVVGDYHAVPSVLEV